jgi:hypothetical protein
MRRYPLWWILLAVSTAGCPGPEAAPDAMALDAEPPVDSPAATRDAPDVAARVDVAMSPAPDAPRFDAAEPDAMLPDSPDVGGPDALPPDAVPNNDCEAVVEHELARCPGDPDRACMWRAWRARCRDERQDAIEAATACMEQMDGSSLCRAFYDPGVVEKRDCLATVRAAWTSARATAVFATYCSLCSGRVECEETPAIPFELLSDSALETLETCLAESAATTCSGARTCLDTVFPERRTCLGGS